MADEQNDRGFAVSDKRHSARQGPESDRSTRASEAPQPPAGERESTKARSGPQTAPPPQEVSFASFAISLGSQAFMHFGDIANPVTQKREQDVAAAQQIIDLLAMLQVKTKGNLTGEEARLLQQLLFDLRMRYVRARG